MGQYALGFMYDYGEGLPDDYVLAYAWYNLAAAAQAASASRDSC